MKEKIIWYVLKRICKVLIRQGPSHKSNLENYYKVMRDALDEEFTEDNMTTLDMLSSECFRNKITI